MRILSINDLLSKMRFEGYPKLFEKARKRLNKFNFWEVSGFSVPFPR